MSNLDEQQTQPQYSYSGYPNPGQPAPQQQYAQQQFSANSGNPNTVVRREVRRPHHHLGHAHERQDFYYANGSNQFAQNSGCLHHGPFCRAPECLIQPPVQLVSEQPPVVQDVMWTFAETFKNPTVVQKELNMILGMNGGRHELSDLKIKKYTKEGGGGSVEFRFKGTLSNPTAMEAVKIYRREEIGFTPVNESEKISASALVEAFMRVLYKNYQSV